MGSESCGFAQMRSAVGEVARHFPTAIISGRCRDKVKLLLENGIERLDEGDNDLILAYDCLIGSYRYTNLYS